MSFTQILSLALGAILVENFIFSKFLGICPFMGVSKKVDTAVGMGVAVIFVMTVASIVSVLIVYLSPSTSTGSALATNGSSINAIANNFFIMLIV